MTDRKSYSDPSRDLGSRDPGSPGDRSLDKDREKNLGSRHGDGSSQGTGSSGSPGQRSRTGESGSSDMERKR
ncbi:MAG TPA: hypothetical protein VKH46_02070 [Thermoanaerobaculia bacterium]|jgi:hypothetical protein|nr:hypothetical protein [Thermoanaerobaculia bacterium]